MININLEGTTLEVRVCSFFLKDNLTYTLIYQLVVVRPVEKKERSIGKKDLGFKDKNRNGYEVN